MNNFVELNTQECKLIGGGRSQWLADIVESASAGIGKFAKLCYLAHCNGMQCLSQRFAMGDQTLWK